MRKFYVNNMTLYIFISVLLFGIYLFFNFGKYLDISNKPKKTDLIVCLGGTKDLLRIKKSVALFKYGFSKTNILLVTGGTENTIKDHKADKRIAYLDTLDNNITIIYNPYTKNTAEEILFIKKYMEEHQYKTVTIVSDPPYTRRISMLADILLNETCDINIVSSEPAWWTKEKYYLNQHSRSMAFSEFVKIPYNYLLYGVIDRFGYAHIVQNFEKKFEIRKKFSSFIFRHQEESKNE